MNKVNRLFDLLDLYRTEYASLDVAFAGRYGGEWITYSANDFVNITERLSAGLLRHGVGKGAKVATIINNCPEWNFIDMAILQIGAIHVPVYPTISADSFTYIFNHADIEYIFIFDKATFIRIEESVRQTKTIRELFSVQPVEGLKHWSQLIEPEVSQSTRERIKAISNTINSSDLATIIYTSGTTGIGKGVMLSHSNLISNFIATSEILAPKKVKVALSFLPLCHVYERMLNYLYQYLGISVYYADSLENLGNTIREVKPEMLCAVPRMLEKIFDKIQAGGRALRQPRRGIFIWAWRLANRYQLYGAKGRNYELRLKIADFLVYSKWRQALGGKLRYIVSGGASLRPRIAKVLWAANIQVIEGYGLTETSPVVAVGTFEPDGIKFGTVGKPLKGVQVKIAPDGEILCKGPNIMMGYYKDEAMTREVIDNEGWFHTGDIGTLIEGKFLKITDRKKEMLKTSGGKYIAPQEIENRFRESPFIENIIVVGDNRNFAAALIVPDFEYVKSWCAIKGIEPIDNCLLVKDQRIIERFNREVNEINKHLGKTEQVKKFLLLPQEWSTITGELSLTLKIRRSFTMEKYKKEIERLYGKKR